MKMTFDIKTFNRYNDVIRVLIESYEHAKRDYDTASLRYHDARDNDTRNTLTNTRDTYYKMERVLYNARCVRDRLL